MILWVARALIFYAVLWAEAPAPAGAEPLRLYTSRTVHVGLRPHSDALDEWALTLQVSVRTPW